MLTVKPWTADKVAETETPFPILQDTAASTWFWSCYQGDMLHNVALSGRSESIWHLWRMLLTLFCVFKAKKHDVVVLMKVRGQNNAHIRQTRLDSWMRGCERCVRSTADNIVRGILTPCCLSMSCLSAKHFFLFHLIPSFSAIVFDIPSSSISFQYLSLLSIKSKDPLSFSICRTLKKMAPLISLSPPCLQTPSLPEHSICCACWSTAVGSFCFISLRPSSSSSPFSAFSSSCSSSTLLNSHQSTGRPLSVLSLQRRASHSTSLLSTVVEAPSGVQTLLISAFVLPHLAPSFSLTALFFFFVFFCFFPNCQFGTKNVGPLQWELRGLCPSMLSPFLTPSLCHFTSAVKCSLSLSLSFPLTLQLSQSSFHLSQTLLFSLPSTKSVVWCWTNGKRQTTKSWRRHLSLSGSKVFLKSFDFNKHFGAFISSRQIKSVRLSFLLPSQPGNFPGLILKPAAAHASFHSRQCFELWVCANTVRK